MLYFLKHPETGLIKIGTTVSYKSRLSDLIRQYGDLELLGIMTGSYEDEKRLHEQFAHLRSHELDGREWFKPEKELLSYINKHTSMNLPLPLDGERIGKRYVNLMVSDVNHATLVILKKKFNVQRMDDVLTFLLQQHDQATFEKGVRIAEFNREMEGFNDSDDEENDE